MRGNESPKEHKRGSVRAIERGESNARRPGLDKIYEASWT